MTLSNADVNRIVKLGYSKEEFLDEIDGFLALKNIEEHCFFLEDKRCLIYESRPQGCRFYPLIFDFESNEFMIDDFCSHYDDFKVEMYLSLYDNVASFVNCLIEEKEQRIKEKEKKVYKI